MKRHHTAEVAGRKLKLSLSFATSLDILDELMSPSEMLLSILAANEARRQGKKPEESSALNERTATKLLEIGNREYEGLSQEEIGNLAFRHGMFPFLGVATDYLAHMVHGSVGDEEELEEFIDDTEGGREDTPKN